MSDAEWAVTEPAVPAPAWTLGKGSRPAEYCRRDIVDGIRYLVKEGIQWRAVPADFPLGAATSMLPARACIKRSELVAADGWSLCVMACRIGRNELSLAGPEGSGHQ